MKKNLITLSFSALLLASSSISSQTSHRESGNSAGSGPLHVAKISSGIADDEIIDALAGAEKKQSKTTLDSVTTEYFSEEELAQLRELFLQAEKAINQKSDSNYLQLSEGLKDYPLYPYLKYQWLIKNLDQEAQVKLFLSLHESSRYADKLKYKWLFHLAKNGQWPLFLQYYSDSSNSSLQCYYHRAQFNTGEIEAALDGARELWSVGYSQPGACDPLFAELKKSSLFTQDLIWQRFDAALQNNKVSLAVYLKNLMPKSHHETAELWLDLHRRPSHHIQKLLKQPLTPQSPSMFTHTISRLANKDLASAIRIWDTHKNKYDIDGTQARALEKRLAFKLAFQRQAGAYERLSGLDNPDSSSQDWRVRAALAEQNWPNVLSAIQAMDEQERSDEKWQYWLARAFLETDEVEQAEKIFSALSKERSFYGYLAADKVNSLYQLSDDPVQVSDSDIAALQAQEEFLVAYELKAIDRNTEAKLQWWHALSQVDKDEIVVAAKLAQRWQWHEIAIFTIAKAKHWDDIEVRFPVSYADDIHQNSEQNNLNPAIIFGLVRRESAFNEKAHSPAGARGLMQIMPNTGKHIAKRLNERWRGSSSLYNPETNIRYGSYYYQSLLEKFNGNYAIALAAYNAGPERVKKWLPEKGTLPADIWIETIPYKETRNYVTSVIAYALIYQQRTRSDELKMDDFTLDVPPLSDI